MQVQDFVNPHFSYAVIGATTHKEKYGYRVLRDLFDAGWHVVGINPKYSIIEDMPVFATLADVPHTIDVAIFVVPPEIGETLLPQVEEKGIQKVWLQPGAENAKLILDLQDAHIAVNDPGSCIMVARRNVG